MLAPQVGSFSNFPISAKSNIFLVYRLNIVEIPLSLPTPFLLISSLSAIITHSSLFSEPLSNLGHGYFNKGNEMASPWSSCSPSLTRSAIAHRVTLSYDPMTARV